MRLSLLVMMWIIGCTTASASAPTIVLSYRPGGFMMDYIREADRWLHQGVQVEVTDWQMSAAAMQIVYFHRRGGTICYRDSSELAKAYLMFHQPSANGDAVEEYRGVFIHYMGEQITEMIGPVVVDQFKAIHASSVGIQICD